MSFIITNPYGYVLGARGGGGAQWWHREMMERFDYQFAIVFPSRESAQDACDARGDGATVEPLPADL